MAYCNLSGIAFKEKQIVIKTVPNEILDEGGKSTKAALRIKPLDVVGMVTVSVHESLACPPCPDLCLLPGI